MPDFTLPFLYCCWKTRKGFFEEAVLSQYTALEKLPSDTPIRVISPNGLFGEVRSSILGNRFTWKNALSALNGIDSPMELYGRRGSERRASSKEIEGCRLQFWLEGDLVDPNLFRSQSILKSGRFDFRHIAPVGAEISDMSIQFVNGRAESFFTHVPAYEALHLASETTPFSAPSLKLEVVLHKSQWNSYWIFLSAGKVDASALIAERAHYYFSDQSGDARSVEAAKALAHWLVLSDSLPEIPDKHLLRVLDTLSASGDCESLLIKWVVDFYSKDDEDEVAQDFINSCQGEFFYKGVRTPIFKKFCEAALLASQLKSSAWNTKEMEEAFMLVLGLANATSWQFNVVTYRAKRPRSPEPSAKQDVFEHAFSRPISDVFDGYCAFDEYVSLTPKNEDGVVFSYDKQGLVKRGMLIAGGQLKQKIRIKIGITFNFRLGTVNPGFTN